MTSRYSLVPVFRALDDGRIVRGVCASAFRIVGVLLGLAGIWAIVAVLRAGFQLGSTSATVGTLVFALLLAAGFFGAMQSIFYRAGTLAQLEPSPYAVIPVVSVVFRTLGEVYASFGAAIALGGCISIWLAQFNPVTLLDFGASLFPRSGAENFVGGLLYLITVAFASFVALLACYFVAEALYVLMSIARDVRGLRETRSAPV